MTKTFIAAAVAAAALAAGCGSNHEGGPGAQDPDAAASGSVAGLVGFAQGQIASTDETSEPRPIAGINPPVSDVDEPAVI